jgi:hypothetical protein
MSSKPQSNSTNPFNSTNQSNSTNPFNSTNQSNSTNPFNSKKPSNSKKTYNGQENEAPTLTQEEKAAAEAPSPVAQQSNGSPSGKGQEEKEAQLNTQVTAEGKNKTYKDLKDMESMQNLNDLSDAIKKQTGFIEQYNTELTEKFAAMRRKITDAVKDAEKRVGKIGLEKAAIEAINTELGKVHEKIMGSIEGLETQVKNYKTTLDNANGNPTGNLTGEREVSGHDESKIDGVKPQTKTRWEKIKSALGAQGGYKSTPRTRKHRKTYRFTATPKSQTMKKRHRTHKKAKKQAKKQNKQRK